MSHHTWVDYLTMGCIAFGSWCFGIIFYLEIAHYASKIDCPIPARYSQEYIKEHIGKGVGVLGLQFETPYLLFKPQPDLYYNVILNIYKVECMQTMINIYEDVEHDDRELREMIGAMDNPKP